MEITPNQIPSVVTQGVSKKQIVALAEQIVADQIEEGFINPLEELVTAIRIQAYAESRIKALRPYATKEMREDKEAIVLAAKVAKGKEPGTWKFDDPYINKIEEELKKIKDKAKEGDPRNRVHVHMETGEFITISPGVKMGGGDDTIRVTL